MKKFLALSLSTLLASFTLVTASCLASPLQENIDAIVKDKPAQIGVVIEGFDPHQHAGFNENTRFPMQSVFKFPVALAVLDQVDKGKINLDETLLLKPSDLLPNTHSPLREKYPEANAAVSIGEIINETVSNSDNNGCDILLRLVGGPQAVDKYIKNLGIADMQIAVNEQEMHTVKDAQHKNWTTPAAMTQVLRLFHDGKLLKPDSQKFLWTAMRDSITAPGRLRSPLPAGTHLIHKTGTSDYSPQDGSTVNDVGIILLPDGNPVFISVLISGSKMSMMDTEKIIASVSGVAWDHFSQEKPGLSIRKTGKQLRELIGFENQ